MKLGRFEKLDLRDYWNKEDADITCIDTINNHLVLIENQLQKTDHTHLGQLMTCASGLDAVTIIWIAQKFTKFFRPLVKKV